MTLDSYDYNLPSSLIAQFPSAVRGEDRLMLLNKTTGETEDYLMQDFPSLLPPNALLVFNNSLVRQARLYATKEGEERKSEFIFLNKMDAEGLIWKVITKNTKKKKAGTPYLFPNGARGEVLNRKEIEAEDKDKELARDTIYLRFQTPLTERYFKEVGHVPLPPYIRREDEKEDKTRYQNIYAKTIGSAACPTAGLHFTPLMFSNLDKRGVECVYITLHVGLGTFLPVREKEIEKHKMHTEHYLIDRNTAERINRAKKAGRPIVAIGTTSLRTLEAAAGEDGFVTAGEGETNIFIYPPYNFRLVTSLFTNFHTPKSTLLMLVAALAGRENILRAYQEAVEKKYKFFSYGDCMFIR